MTNEQEESLKQFLRDKLVIDIVDTLESDRMSKIRVSLRFRGDDEPFSTDYYWSKND